MENDSLSGGFAAGVVMQMVHEEMTGIVCCHYLWKMRYLALDSSSYLVARLGVGSRESFSEVFAIQRAYN